MNTKETNKMCIESTVNQHCIKGLFEKKEEETTFKILNPGVVSKQKRVLAIEVVDKDFELVETKTQKIVKSDIFCHDIKEKANKVSEKLDKYEVCKLHFEHEFNPEEIFAIYTLRKTIGNAETHKKTSLKQVKTSNQKAYKISDKLTLLVDEITKKLTFEFKTNNKTYKYDLNHSFYKVFEKNNSELKPEGVNPSGAYIFSSTDLLPETFEIDLSKSYIENGDLLDLIFL